MAGPMMFITQKLSELDYQYENEFVLEAEDKEKIMEVVYWCAHHATDKWSYIKVSDHVNIDPITERTVEDCKQLLLEYPNYNALDYFGHGAYREYVRLTFSSKKDALHFKMVWG